MEDNYSGSGVGAEDDESAIDPQQSQHHHRHRRHRVKKSKKVKQLPQLTAGISSGSGANTSMATRASPYDLEEEEKEG